VGVTWPVAVGKKGRDVYHEGKKGEDVFNTSPWGKKRESPMCLERGGKVPATLCLWGKEKKLSTPR